MTKQDQFSVNFTAQLITILVVKKTARLSLKLTPELRKRLEERAAAKDRSVNWVATKFIEDGILREEPPPYGTKKAEK